MTRRNYYPKISIVTAVLNGAATLQRCIDSVVDQTYLYKELIIMDGGSTDGSVDILKANNRTITCWESKPDLGIYHAWNKALDKVNGEWVFFIGADDYFWSNDVLMKIVPMLTAAQNKSRIVYGRIALTSPTGDILEIHGKPWNDLKKRFFQGKCLPHQGVFHHCSLFENYGGFDTSLKIAGDYEFLFRELKKADAHYVDVLVAGQQIGGVANDPFFELQTLREYIVILRKHLGKVPVQFYWTYLKAHTKKVIRCLIGKKLTKLLVDFYRFITNRPKIWTR
ncbi:MAG: glycosyltransferase family 2 protein [Nitrospirota bacterium]|nr:glycosyltransferase family 2 protein [Nitrospirota bacterium]